MHEARPGPRRDDARLHGAEHERAAGAWQAEWGTLTDLLRLTGSAAAWGRDMLEHLEVDAAGRRGWTDADLGASSELIDRALEAHRA